MSVVECGSSKAISGYEITVAAYTISLPGRWPGCIGFRFVSAPHNKADKVCHRPERSYWNISSGPTKVVNAPRIRKVMSKRKLNWRELG
jgi:hypothetical protein